MKAYPFENLLLSNIKNERWEDIPGLDGHYSVSSYGRIKRSRYEMQYKNGAIYVKPEKIIKQLIVTTPNRFKKDFKKFLSSRVVLKGKKSFLIKNYIEP